MSIVGQRGLTCCQFVGGGVWPAPLSMPFHMIVWPHLRICWPPHQTSVSHGTPACRKQGRNRLQQGEEGLTMRCL